MAQRAANPMVVLPADVAAATLPVGAPVYSVFAGNMVHAQIEYADYTADTDHVEVWDRFGNIIARLDGAADLRTVRTGRTGWVYGVSVPQTDKDGNPNLTSGKLFIYFE